MKQFLRWYPLLLKAQLKKIETWIAIGAMLVMVIIISGLKIPSKSNFEVAIHCDNPAVAVEMEKRLQEKDSVFHFVLEENLEQMKVDVINGTYECGFSIVGDLKDKLVDLDQEGVITYFCSSFTTRGEVAKETVYLALLEIESEIYLQVKADELYETPDENLLKLLKERQEYYFESDELLSITSQVLGAGADDADGTDDADGADRVEPGETGADGADGADRVEPGEAGADDADGAVPEVVEKKTTAPYKGTVALVLFLSVFLAIGDYLGKQTKGYPMYLPARERFGFAFTNTLAAATPVALIGYVLTLALGEGGRNWFVMLLLMLATVLYAFLWCYGLGKLLRKENRYMSTLLAVILLAAVMTNAFIDLSEYVPVLRVVRLILPPSLYLI